ncbi:MAG: transcriptional regulator [Rhizorhabdus sp.]|nr:transcriptional regulator [Rhizorhabdus sp.]
MSGRFTNYDDGDVRDLIRDYPLAWLCAADGQAEHAAQLPLLGEYNQGGSLTHLLGHIPRHSPLMEPLSRNGRALVLFQGPQAYISPDQAGVRDWAPTWNFVHLRINAEVEFLPNETGSAIMALVERMERDRSTPWTIAELGPRYPQMELAVIGFRARVLSVEGRFKLGQDEQPEVLQSILDALGDTPLADWMRRFSTRTRDRE